MSNVLKMSPSPYLPSSQVKSLQQEAVVLREGIAGGKVGVAHVQSALETMTRGHAHLAAAVSMVATSLEVVNQQSRGRAAKHIAASHTSLGSEVYIHTCILQTLS